MKTPFYRVVMDMEIQGRSLVCDWKATEKSRYFNSPLLYKENGFKEEKDARELIRLLMEEPTEDMTVDAVEKKKETKNPPLLYNLAELQNDCSKFFKISPDETLRIAQELYEKKMTTYPRTDARVLSSAVAKEIHKNIRGIQNYEVCSQLAAEVLSSNRIAGIAKSRYVNDKQITDHYAIIPTGQGLSALRSLNPTAQKVYEIIVRRFLSIFYPPAIYRKVSLTLNLKGEQFFASFKVLEEEGYLKAARASFFNTKKKQDENEEEDKQENGEQENEDFDIGFLKALHDLKKGDHLPAGTLEVKEGETSPPKRYNSGSMILTMENAGQFIEDEELRSQIKGSGIGTSATRAEILKKLFNINYLSLNKKTQIITPTLMGEMIYEVVGNSIRPLLDPALTASWEKGLTMVAEGTITEEEYMKKLDDFVRRRTNVVKQLNNQSSLTRRYQEVARNYSSKGSTQKGK